jgi:hypothetical protein
VAALAALMALLAGAGHAGVISHWSFDSDFTDPVGGHNGTANGSPAITTSDYQFGGGALSLDGSSYLRTANWSMGGTYTVAAWVKPGSISTDWAGFLNKQETNGQKVFWLGQRNTDGRVRFGNYYDNSSESALDIGFAISNGQWTHIAASWDEATDLQTVYVNGRQVGQVHRAGQTQPAGNDPLNIGRSTGPYFTGAIDEAWIYDQALTGQQVRNLMANNDIAKDDPHWVRDTWDFESGDLSGWNVLTSGVPGDNAVFTTPGNQPAVLPHSGSYEDQTIQGTHWIRTWEGEGLGTGDDHTGIIETAPFILEPDAKFDFMIGGGNHPFTGDPDTPASNITALTLERMIAVNNWDVLFSATGRNVNFLSPMTWDASAFAGETVRLRIYDTSTSSWGHIDVDNIIYSVTPEPATLSLLGLGALALARRRRRRSA